MIREGGLDNTTIRQAGLRVTPSRVKILDVLATNDKRHLSAEDVYKVLLVNREEIGLTTVYRVLTQFAGAGLVRRHQFEGKQSVFELNRGGRHDHLVCVRCGKVVEFLDEGIAGRQRAVALDHGFTLENHSLLMYGVCADCRV